MNLIEKWFSELKRIWLAKDISAVHDLLANEFKYFEHPLEEPLTNWEQVEAAWQEVKNQNISKLEINPLVVTDREGSASYEFEYSDASGNHTSTGSYYVKIDEHGKAVEFRQWWMTN